MKRAVNPEFTVERVEFDRRGHAYVHAAMIDPATFSVTEGSRFGGARLNVEEFSEPKLGVFRFRLESSAEAASFHVGDVVALETP